jgi:hypothetical protein
MLRLSVAKSNQVLFICAQAFESHVERTIPFGSYLHHSKTLVPLMMNIYTNVLDEESKGSAKRPCKGHNLNPQQIETLYTLDKL